MTDSKLSLLVSETVKLDRHIRRLEVELDERKKLLISEAESRADEAQSTEGGGTSITFEGLEGSIARVTKAGATLVSTLNPEQAKFAKVKAAAGPAFASLFTPSVVYRPIERFREKAELSLGSAASKLVKLCTTGGKTSVAFETKEGA